MRFFPALLAVSGDVARAARLQDSSFAMWNRTGIEPEVYDYRARKIAYQGYALRPEIVESTYYLSHFTHDPKYLEMGRTLLRDFVRYCRNDIGYAALKNVTTKEKKDRMESFVFAETFKYFYLLFAPQKLDFDAVTFNTEAHPLRATWAGAGAKVDANTDAAGIAASPGASASAAVERSPAIEPAPRDLSAWVEPRIGSAHGGNTFPGAVVPFGMLAWSPETTRGNHLRTTAPGGYAYDTTKIRGFSLTHLSGTGCAGASGDVPFMPIIGEPATSPSLDAKDENFANHFAHANEIAEPGYYAVTLDDRVKVELTAAARSGAARFRYPGGRSAGLLIRTSDSEVGSSAATVDIDPATNSVRGSVTSGNFCGYLDKRRPAQLLHAVFRRAVRPCIHGARHLGERQARRELDARERRHRLRRQGLAGRRQGIRRVAAFRHGAGPQRRRARRHLVREPCERAGQSRRGTTRHEAAHRRKRLVE